MSFTRRTAHVCVALASAIVLATGCSQESSEDTARQSDSLVVREQWVKAADTGMTAAFAELQNTGSTDIQIVGASSPSSARAELHETATGSDGTMVMREKEDGFVIPAGETHVLAAGGDHLMLMELTSPLTPGADAEFTLEFEDSSTTTFSAQVRDFAGAQEEYAPGHGMPDDADASHGG